eukprot:640208-Alexandrium_andersonii.AAC.1
MSASLVGSEMCIRDSPKSYPRAPQRLQDIHSLGVVVAVVGDSNAPALPCLLYTSDAADDM